MHIHTDESQFRKRSFPPPPHEMGPATEKSKHPELDMERVHQVRNELSEVRGNEKRWERATRGTPTGHNHEAHPQHGLNRPWEGSGSGWI